MTAPPPERPLALLTNLFGCLSDRQIRYCYWKSTHNLARGLHGKTDLDLLVDRAQATTFRNILSASNYRPVLSHPRRQFPAIEDYLGFDPTTGQLAHLHIHYQLIIGQEFVKNYYLPLEHPFLENTRTLGGVRVPIPELELIVLMLRMLLKYRDRDVVGDLTGMSHWGLPKTSIDEFRALRAQTTDEHIICVQEKLVPIVSSDLLMEFLSVMHRTPHAGATLYRLRRRAHAELAPYRRLAPMQANGRYWNAILQQTPPFDRLGTNSEKRKISTSGGIMFAFVGADGAGKSTVVKEVSRWLGWRLNVKNLYMGTTQPSRKTKLFRTFSLLAAIPYAATCRIVGKEHRVTKIASNLEQVSVALRLLAEGRDRYDRYCAGRQSAARGCVVIFDRYPLPQANLFGRGMDGPRIATLGSGKPRGMLKKLAGAEQSLYQKILTPEHLFALQVSPDVSQTRKPDHDANKVRAKSRALLDLDLPEGELIAIDADQPLADVLLQVKTHIWSLL